MRTIFAEYNPGSDCALNTLAVYLACFLTTQEKYFYPRPTCIFRI